MACHVTDTNYSYSGEYSLDMPFGRGVLSFPPMDWCAVAFYGECTASSEYAEDEYAKNGASEYAKDCAACELPDHLQAEWAAAPTDYLQAVFKGVRA